MLSVPNPIKRLPPSSQSHVVTLCSKYIEGDDMQEGAEVLNFLCVLCELCGE